MIFEGNMEHFGRLVEEAMEGRFSRSAITVTESAPMLDAAHAFNA
jgi:hypothetical protein